VGLTVAMSKKEGGEGSNRDGAWAEVNQVRRRQKDPQNDHKPLNQKVESWARGRLVRGRQMLLPPRYRKGESIAKKSRDFESHERRISDKKKRPCTLGDGQHNCWKKQQRANHESSKSAGTDKELTKA